MLYVANPGILSSGAESLKTYADYEVWLNAQGAPSASPTTTVRSAGYGRRVVTLEASYSGTMWGSSWYWPGYFTNDSTFSRIIQHAFPTLEFANANLGRKVIINTSDLGDLSNFPGVSRNNYVSSDYQYDFNAAECFEMHFFNDLTGKIVRVYPNSASWSEISF